MIAVDALVERGLAAWQTGDLEAAREDCEAALARAPDHSGAWAGLGAVLWSTSEFAAALDAYRHACRHQPDNPAHWSNIGLCLRDLGRFAQAIHAFEVAVALAPGYAAAYNEWANVLGDLGRPHDALPLYLRSLALDDRRAVVHHNLGVCCNRLGDRAAARQKFRDALERDPNYHHSLEELALLLAADGAVSDALDLLRRAGTERARRIADALAGDP